MTIRAPEGHVHWVVCLFQYPNHGCGNGGTCVYTGGFYRLRYPQSRFLAEGGTSINPQYHHMPSMSMTTRPTDGAIYI